MDEAKYIQKNLEAAQHALRRAIEHADGAQWARCLREIVSAEESIHFARMRALKQHTLSRLSK